MEALETETGAHHSSGYHDATSNPLILDGVRNVSFLQEMAPLLLSGYASACACQYVQDDFVSLGRVVPVQDVPIRIDLTATFQRSTCCQATLETRRQHYACSCCGQTSSRFLFDERAFDSQYFVS